MIVIFLVGNEWKGRMFAMAFSESSHAINNITSEDFRLFLQLVCYSWTPWHEEKNVDNCFSALVIT